MNLADIAEYSRQIHFSNSYATIIEYDNCVDGVKFRLIS